MKLLKMIARLFLIVAYALALLVQTITELFLDIGESITYALAGFFYPVLIALIAMLPVEDEIDLIFSQAIVGNAPSQSLSDFVSICGEVFLLTMFINIIIQLFACLFGGNKHFVIMFKAQKSISTYTMTILSLAALWIASVIPTFAISSEKNLMLFVFGLLYFLSTLFCDIYYYLFISKGKIESMFDDIKKQWNKMKKDDKDHHDCEQ